MPCGLATATRTDPENAARTQYLRLDCKKLSCPQCGPKRARAYLRAIAKAAEEHKLCRHITLTLDPKRIPAGMDSVEYIRELWSYFRVYLFRKFHIAPQFICVLELQENGNAHLHVLMSQTMVQNWIIESWVAVGGGHQDRIRYTDVHRIARYLAPYVTKQVLERIPPGRRKVTTSRGICLFPKRPPSGWSYSKEWMIDVERRSFGCLQEIEYDEGGVRWIVIESPPLTGLTTGLI